MFFLEANNIDRENNFIPAQLKRKKKQFLKKENIIFGEELKAHSKAYKSTSTICININNINWLVHSVAAKLVVRSQVAR